MRSRIVFVALLLSTFSVIAEPVRLSIKEALKINKNKGYRGNPALGKAMWAAIRKLEPQEKEEALKVLLSTLGHFKEYGHGRGAFIARAFTMLPELAVAPLIQALKNDDKWRDAVVCLTRLGKKVALPVAEFYGSAQGELKQRALSVLVKPEVVNGQEPVIPYLLNSFNQTTDINRKRGAAQALAACVPKHNRPAIFAKYKDQLLSILGSNNDISITVFIIKALGNSGASEDKVITTLIPYSESKSLSVRVAAVSALGTLGTGNKKAFEALKKSVLDANDLLITIRAADALGALGKSGQEQLIRNMANENIDIAYYSTLALAECVKKSSSNKVANQQIVNMLIKHLQSKNPGIRRFSAFAIAKIGPKAKAARSEIIKLLEDPQVNVRINAIEALASIVPQDAVVLIKVFLNDPSPKVSRATASAISRIVKNQPELDKILETYQKQAAWKERESTTEIEPLADAELEKFEAGGPLAGLKLPRYQGQHGEKPGYPGCIPELAITDLGKWRTQGVAPQMQLYPGSVENYRTYWFKYCPVRSFYDQQSLIKNWVAPAIPGARKSQQSTYAEPVYWVPRHSPPAHTGKFRKAVPVIKCEIDSPVFKLDCGKLKPGIYMIRAIAAVPEEKPRPFPEPLFFSLKINDGLNGEINRYRKRSGYVDQFYGIAEFSFHALTERDFSAELTVAKGSLIISNGGFIFFFMIISVFILLNKYIFKYWTFKMLN